MRVLACHAACIVLDIARDNVCNAKMVDDSLLFVEVASVDIDKSAVQLSHGISMHGCHHHNQCRIALHLLKKIVMRESRTPVLRFLELAMQLLLFPFRCLGA